MFSNSVLRILFGTVSANVVSQLIMMSALAYSVNIYNASDFGLFALVFGIGSVLSVCSSFRYELAIPLPKSIRVAKQISVICIAINLIFSISIFISIFIIDQFINLNVNYYLISLIIFSIGQYRVLNFWMVRNDGFNILAKSKLLQSVFYSLILVGLGYIYPNSTSIILAQVFSQLISVIYLSINSSSFMVKSTKRLILYVFRKYNKFPTVDLPSAIFNMLSTQLANIGITIFFGASYGGVYLMAEKILLTPVSIVAQAISQISYNRINRIGNKEKQISLLFKLLAILSVSVVAGWVVFQLIGMDIISFIFKDEWSMLPQISSILLFNVGFQFIYAPLSLCILVFNMHRFNLYTNLVLFLVKSLALLIGYLCNDIMVFVYISSGMLSLVYLISIMFTLNTLKFKNRVLNADKI